MSEIFKDVVDYEGLYAISNEGNVKSLWYGKERILKPADRGNGYLFVLLCKDGQRKHHQVHRLVANAFIPNPDSKPEVNHKDEDKTNNFVFVNEDGSVDYEKSNLEWCTREENCNYGTRNQRMAEAKSIPVDMLTKEGELIRTFPSSMEAMRWLRANGYLSASQGHINQCCKGKLQSCYGFKWRYAQGN